MLSSSPPQKRRLPHIPTPQDLARLFKRPRLDPAPVSSNTDQPRIPPGPDSSVLHNLPDPLVLSNLPLPHLQGTQNYAPVLHCIPQGAFPILERPYTVADFFSDVPSRDLLASNQHLRSATAFPPPMPPPSSLLNVPHGESSGVMVPFVYPALPSIKYDPWTVYPEGSLDESALPRSDNVLGTDLTIDKRSKKRAAESERLHVDENKNLDSFSEVTHPVMAPLPFPPPNFMPYPIMADRAPLIPREVFSSWIEASKHLPRVDMVLASAAGSIYDMHSQAVAEGFNTTELDELLRLDRLDKEVEVQPVHFSDDEDSSFAEYVAYASNVDTSTVQDAYIKPVPENYLVVQSDSRIRAVHVSQRTSKDAMELNGELNAAESNVVESNVVESNVVESKAMESKAMESKAMESKAMESKAMESKAMESKAMESNTIDNTIDSNTGLAVMEATEVPFHVPRFEVSNNKDVIMSNSVQREKRRQALAKMVGDLENHEHVYRAQLYAQKKQQLLARLESLQNCKISFDNDPSQIADSELRDYAEKRQAQRDEELVRLRATYNYEKLKNLLNFYQTSHRSYKAMNATMINKLQKLRNFFEHQRQVLDSVTRTADSDAKNMRSRESEKLYSGFVEQEYGNEIKEEFRSAVAREEGDPQNQTKTFDASLFTRVYKGHEHSATVEDYMPLVTKEEFKLITGDAPAKTVNKDAGNKGKSARHQIFQSLLYDRATSGSDTDTPTVKRRPGRRAAPKPTYGEEAKVSNDAALVAKIMKQFVGPGSANPEELVHDLETIGIKTKWPVK